MDALTAELEAACLRALSAAWHDVNHGRFRGQLSPPALELSTAGSRLGGSRAASMSTSSPMSASRTGAGGPASVPSAASLASVERSAPATTIRARSAGGSAPVTPASQIASSSRRPSAPGGSLRAS